MGRPITGSPRMQRSWEGGSQCECKGYEGPWRLFLRTKITGSAYLSVGTGEKENEVKGGSAAVEEGPPSIPVRLADWAAGHMIPEKPVL